MLFWLYISFFLLLCYFILFYLSQPAYCNLPLGDSKLGPGIVDRMIVRSLQLLAILGLGWPDSKKIYIHERRTTVEMHVLYSFCPGHANSTVLCTAQRPCHDLRVAFRTSTLGYRFWEYAMNLTYLFSFGVGKRICSRDWSRSNIHNISMKPLIVPNSG